MSDGDGSPVTIAVAQVCSAREPSANLEKAHQFAAKAAAAGAAMLVFPEYFMSWGEGRHGADEMLEVAQPLDGPFLVALRDVAREHSLWLTAGVIESPHPGESLSANTVVIIDCDGELRACYRKTHLFDAFGYLESTVFARGQALALPVGTPAGRTGIFVCYELRYPEVARSLALDGAETLIVPAAWVAGPGKTQQWETLVRARAIENGCWVIAAGQCGNEFIGHSMVVDPMGEVAGVLDQEEDLLLVDITPDRVAKARAQVPSLAQRRPELYRKEG